MTGVRVSDPRLLGATKMVETSSHLYVLAPEARRVTRLSKTGMGIDLMSLDLGATPLDMAWAAPSIIVVTKNAVILLSDSTLRETGRIAGSFVGPVAVAAVEEIPGD